MCGKISQKLSCYVCMLLLSAHNFLKIILNFQSATFQKLFRFLIVSVFLTVRNLIGFLFQTCKVKEKITVTFPRENTCALLSDKGLQPTSLRIRVKSPKYEDCAAMVAT